MKIESLIATWNKTGNLIRCIIAKEKLLRRFFQDPVKVFL